MRKIILITIISLPLAILAAIYWKITVIIASAFCGCLLFALAVPTPVPPYRDNMSEEEWDDYEHQRYAQINARRRRDRILAARQIKSKTNRFKRTRERRRLFYE